MGMGRKRQRQESLWIATQELPRTKGHVFYERVNRILEGDGFDRFVEEACQKFYAPVMGRPGVVPATSSSGTGPPGSGLNFNSPRNACASRFWVFTISLKRV